MVDPEQLVHLIFYTHEHARSEQRTHGDSYIKPLCLASSPLTFQHTRHPSQVMEGFMHTLQNDTPPPSPQAQCGVQPPKQRRLPKVALDIMKNFARNVTPDPTISQREDIAEEIQKIPGCNWYTKNQVYRWFAVHRNTEAKKKAEALAAVHRTLFPSFREEDFIKLERLLKDDPNPSPVTVDCWAASLSINAGELRRWIIWQKERADRKPSVALLSSISPSGPYPEAGPSSVSARKLPPLIVDHPPRSVTSHLPTPQSTVSPESTPKPTPQPAPAAIREIPNSIRRARALAAVLKEDPHTQNQALAERIPQTLEEFNSVFAPHETRIQTFMERVTHGEFERIGLKPAYAKPLSEKL